MARNGSSLKSKVKSAQEDAKPRRKRVKPVQVTANIAAVRMAWRDKVKSIMASKKPAAQDETRRPDVVAAKEDERVAVATYSELMVQAGAIHNPNLKPLKRKRMESEAGQKALFEAPPGW